MYYLLLVLVNDKSLIEICDQITLELGFFDLAITCQNLYHLKKCLVVHRDTLMCSLNEIEVSFPKTCHTMTLSPSLLSLTSYLLGYYISHAG